MTITRPTNLSALAAVYDDIQNLVDENPDRSGMAEIAAALAAAQVHAATLLDRIERIAYDQMDYDRGDLAEIIRLIERAS